MRQEVFDQLLAWLGPDRERAGEKYEEIRYRLIKIFIHRGCPIAEELADETIDRVAHKAPQVIGAYQASDPALYFYGVAQNVFLEYVKKKPDPKPLPPPDPPEEKERRQECLDRCLGELDPPSRDFILRYYKNDKGAKIEHRKGLAAEMGVSLNGLRVRAHRIKASLQACMRDCLAQSEI